MLTTRDLILTTLLMETKLSNEYTEELYEIDEKVENETQVEQTKED